ACLGSSECPGVLLELTERLLESLEGIAHATLHRVFPDSRDGCDFLKGHVSQVAQQEHFALFFWQLFDSRDHASSDLTRKSHSFAALLRVWIGDARSRDRAGLGVVVQGRVAAMLLFP